MTNSSKSRYRVTVQFAGCLMATNADSTIGVREHPELHAVFPFNKLPQGVPKLIDRLARVRVRSRMVTKRPNTAEVARAFVRAELGPGVGLSKHLDSIPLGNDYWIRPQPPRRGN